MADKTGMEFQTVKILPEDVTIRVESGATLLEAVASAGVRINARCGGSGSCGRCKVRIEEGRVRELEGKTPKLTQEERDGGVRLACRCEVVSDLVVEVPESSRVARLVLDEKKALAGRRTVPPCEWEDVLAAGEHQPPVRKFYLELPPPSLQDNTSDLSRLVSAVNREYGLNVAHVDYQVLKTMPAVLRDADWKVTASILCEGASGEPGGGEVTFKSCRGLRLVRLEPGDTTGTLVAAAIDVGTTSIHVELVDVPNRRRLAKTAEYNGQTACGEDVISRIVYSLKEDHLEQLQKAAAGTIDDLLAALLEKTGLTKGDISFVVAAGNTTMTQLLAAVKPKFIREAPYVPAVNSMPWITAADTGLSLPANTPVYLMPCVASYVGGDIVSGVMGYGMARREELVLYLDLGTNGEVVVGNKDWLMTASCSAGPAFEGGGLRCGMRAANGAVQDFYIDPETKTPIAIIVGGEKAVGVCGSGVIAVLAELLRFGILQQNGKLDQDADPDRVRKGDEGLEYVIVPKEKAGVDRDIVITEADLDNVIRAKAAVYAGCNTLLGHVGLEWDMLDRVVLTGSFGNYVDINSAIFIGLLPELPVEKFCFIKNGSLLGARLGSFSAALLSESEKIARSMTNIELSEDPSFMDSYMAAMFLPHTDASRFPGVAGELEAVRKVVK